jgi:RNA-directed DNA polymerase
MSQPDLSAWRSYFDDHAIDPRVADIYIEYVRQLLQKKVPVIFEFEHLASLLGRKTAYLASVINSPQSHYRSFSIRKRQGGTRQIDAPFPALLQCQQWINKNILHKVRLSDHCNGFVKNRSILTNALPHLNTGYLLKMDLLNFFPSISINRVISVYMRLGYPRNVSVYLAKISCLRDSLPQGAATSPALSNIIASPMDVKLAQLAQSHKLQYTRYADDMTFSGSYISPSFASIVSTIIWSEGFHVNIGKTRLHRSGGAKVVTGISVGGVNPRLPKHLRRKIRQETYYVVKHGYFSHMSKLKVRSACYLDSLLGKVRFWLTIEPENNFAREMETKLMQILSP